MSKKYRKVCTTLNYIQQFLILAFTINECISIKYFLLSIPIGTASSRIVSKYLAITAWVKKYKSIIKKKKKKHIKVALLAKSKLSRSDVLVSKTLIDLNISHDEFVLIINAVIEYDDMKEEIKI